MSAVFSKFFSQNLASVDQKVELRQITIQSDPLSDRATRLRSIAHDVASALRSTKCAAVIPIGGGQVTWLLANIGYALAETRISVCLVEADFRAPQLASVFDLPTSRAGLAQVLDGKIELAASLREITPHLKIVPAGDYHGDVVGLIDSSQFVEALKELSGTCDLILVICPSAADYLDYSFIARVCEGAFLVAQRNKCRMADVIATRDQLTKLGVPLAYALLAKRWK